MWIKAATLGFGAEGLNAYFLGNEGKCASEARPQFHVLAGISQQNLWNRAG
jgi:hypothetical protein